MRSAVPDEFFLSLELGLTVRSAVSRVEGRDVNVGDDPCHPAFSSHPHPQRFLVLSLRRSG